MEALDTAARALAVGDALGALRQVALLGAPPALALRGIAMAQLGEHARARELLRRAARGFGPHDALARARCVVAEAEVALALRDLGGATRPLLAAVTTLQRHGDHANALLARLVAVRRALLLGRLTDAATALEPLAARAMPPALRAVAELAAAELQLRALRTGSASAALARAQVMALRAGVPALVAEVQEACAAMERPAARRLSDGGPQLLRLDAVAALLQSGALIVDGCRRGLQCGAQWVALARRPVLFLLANALAQAWPGDADRQALIATAFRIRRPDETHRARLRVELGRLRALLAGHARIEATSGGFALRPLAGQDVVVLAPPIDGEQAALLALLSDGAAWSTSALGLAMGASQRTVQRALAALASDGRVRAIGQARTRRWLAQPLAGFTTILLLPTTLPSG